MRASISRALLIVLISLPVTAVAGQRLKMRRLGQVRVGDVLVGHDKGTAAVPVHQMGVGSIIYHPIAPMVVESYAATKTRVKLSWREGGRVRRASFLLGDELRGMPAEGLHRARVTEITRLGGRVHLQVADLQDGSTSMVSEAKPYLVLVERGAAPRTQARSTVRGAD